MWCSHVIWLIYSLFSESDRDREREQERKSERRSERERKRERRGERYRETAETLSLLFSLCLSPSGCTIPAWIACRYCFRCVCRRFTHASTQKLVNKQSLIIQEDPLLLCHERVYLPFLMIPIINLNARENEYLCTWEQMSWCLMSHKVHIKWLNWSLYQLPSPLTFLSEMVWVVVIIWTHTRINNTLGCLLILNIVFIHRLQIQYLYLCIF